MTTIYVLPIMKSMSARRGLAYYARMTQHAAPDSVRRLGRRDALRALIGGTGLIWAAPLLGACGAGASSALPAPAQPSSTSSSTSGAPAAGAPSLAASPAGAPIAGQSTAQTILYGAANGTPAETPFAIAEARGYFKDAGVNVEVVPGLVGSRMVPAIGAGQLDLTGGSLALSVINAINRGVPIKIAGSSGYYKDRSTSATWLVRRTDLKDKMPTLASVRGAKIGLIAPDSIPEYCVARGFQKAGVDWKQAVDPQILDFPSMVRALANKELALAILAEPLVTQAEAKGIAERWLSGPELVGRPIDWTLLIAGPSLYKKADAAVRWFKAYIRGQRDYVTAFITKNDPAVRKQALDVLNKLTNNSDPALYDKTTFWLTGPNAPADALPDEASLRDQLDYWKNRGAAVPAYDQLVDVSLAKAAAKQLG